MDIMDCASGAMSRADCIIRGRRATQKISMSYGNIHGDNPMHVESPRELCYPRESWIWLATVENLRFGNFLRLQDSSKVPSLTLYVCINCKGKQNTSMIHMRTRKQQSIIGPFGKEKPLQNIARKIMLYILYKMKSRLLNDIDALY